MRMQNTEDFDLQVRSMLEDAEVRPSRRVWKAVSSRLEAERGNAFPVWMRWACTGLAACAACLGVLLAVRHQTDPILTNINNQDQLLAQTALVAQSEPAAVSLPEELSAPEQAAAPAVAVRRQQPKAAQPAVEATPSLQEEAIAPQEPVVIGPEPAAPKEEPAVAENVASKEPEAQDYMPIVWEQEKTTAPRRAQLYAQGVLLANESDFRVGARRSYGSSGVAQTKTGVKDLDNSSYGIPFSVGLGVRFYVLPKLAIGTGLDYSFLTRTFKGQYTNEAQNIDETGTVTHNMHYLGIPINISYDFVSGNKLLVYVHGGAEAEYCLANKYKIISSKTYDYSSTVKGPQWSVGAGLGVQFRVTDNFGLYLDPGLRYYFNCNQPKNIRTDKPLMVNFDAGLRFNF